MSAVTRTEIRGQCEKGHVVKGEVFGPELPAEWLDSCPLPDCGHEIVWQRRPDYLAPSAPVPERDEFAGYDESAKLGILHIRSLPDNTVLLAARSPKSWAHSDVMVLMGPKTNPSWVTGQCAEEAYRRGLISETEFDYLMDVG